MNDKKNILDSLKGQTDEEKLQEVEDRIFILEMIDTWNKEDYELMDLLYEAKTNLERKIKYGRKQ